MANGLVIPQGGRSIMGFGQALMGLTSQRRQEAEARSRYQTELADRRAYREQQLEAARNREARIRESGEFNRFSQALGTVAGAGSPETARAAAEAYSGAVPDRFSGALERVASTVQAPEPEPNVLEYRGMEFADPDEYLRLRGREAAATRAPERDRGPRPTPWEEEGFENRAEYLDYVRDYNRAQGYDVPEPERETRMPGANQVVSGLLGGLSQGLESGALQPQPTEADGLSEARELVGRARELGRSDDEIRAALVADGLSRQEADRLLRGP